MLVRLAAVAAEVKEKAPQVEAAVEFVPSSRTPTFGTVTVYPLPSIVTFFAIEIADVSTIMSEPKTIVSPAAALAIAVTKADFVVIPVTVAALAAGWGTSGVKPPSDKPKEATRAKTAL
jgi:hypothetical protein